MADELVNSAIMQELPIYFVNRSCVLLKIDLDVEHVLGTLFIKFYLKRGILL